MWWMRIYLGLRVALARSAIGETMRSGKLAWLATVCQCYIILCYVWCISLKCCFTSYMLGCCMQDFQSNPEKSAQNSVSRYCAKWGPPTQREGPFLHKIRLPYTNFVLVHENDFLAADMRPHGLIELVFGEDQFLFPTFLPKWINWPTLQSFLEPISPRAHFGITMHGSYNGNTLGHRLVRCANGFFIQVHYVSTPFLLSELFQCPPACCHLAYCNGIPE